MSGSGRRKRAPSSSEDLGDDLSYSSTNESHLSSHPSSDRLRYEGNVNRPHSVHSSSSATASDSQTSLAFPTTHQQPHPETSSVPNATKKPKTRKNGKKSKRGSSTSPEPPNYAHSTSSSGFSSAMSDTSAHSTTSATSSPYASGSVFHRLNPNDIKYRDEKAKVLRTYVVGRLIGEGSYGKVKEGIDSKTKKLVAIKILSKKTLRRVPGGEASIEREIGIIESLSHKNIISIFTHFPIEAKQKFYIVFEYMGGGTLSHMLEYAPNKRLPLYQARKLFISLLSALEHLRERRVLHRDLKPDNLLLDSDGELKIADFGVAEIVSADLGSKLKENSGIGSPAFQAPELIASPTTNTKKSKRSTADLIFKSDIWSAGIVLYIMVVGQYPFPIQGNIMLLFEDIAAGKFEIPDWVDPNCADLIASMLQTSPQERIDLPGIRAHPFVKESVPKTTPIHIPSIPSMWPNHDKTTLASIVKKMKPQLEREEEQERAARYSFDMARSSADDGGDDRPRSSQSSTQSKCAIM
jgi:serine/threonine-protein kinase 11